MPTTQSVLSEEVSLLLRALQRHSRPVAMTNIQGSALPKPRLKELLGDLVKAGQVQSGKDGRSTVYWLPSLEQQAKEQIIEALTENPKIKTDLDKSFRSRLPGWPKKKREEMLKELLSDKQIHRLRSGQGYFYCVQPSDPRGYLLAAVNKLSSDVDKIAQKLKADGVTLEQVVAAAYALLQQSFPAVEAAAPVEPAVEYIPQIVEQSLPPEPKPAPAPEPTPATPESTPLTIDQGQLILDGMAQLDAAVVTGAPILVSQLRQSLAASFPDKASFDQTVWRLAEAGRVALHWHDYPGSLSQEEREAMVSGERGYYIAISLRD